MTTTSHKHARRGLLLTGGAAVLALVFVLGFHAARASVPPDDVALVYSGVLEDNGELVEGTRSINVAIFQSAEADAPLLCQSGSVNVVVERGRFKVPMPTACAGALREPGDSFVDVILDGDSLGRARIAVVPFALAAGEASAATPGSNLDAALDVATAAGVPSGAVMAFDLDACPPGWTELAIARGRSIVGTNPDATNGLTPRTRGQLFGVERVQLGISEMPRHAHGGVTQTPVIQGGGSASGMDYTVLGGPFRGFQYLQVTNPFNTFNGHTHGITAEGGGAAHENMQPSIALLHCRRD